MQMTANIPGMPDFYSHRAAKDPEPGSRYALPDRPRLQAIAQRTQVVLREIDKELVRLACRAENHLREAPGMRMEAKELAAAVETSVQRLDLCMRSHPRVQKETADTGRKYANRMAVRAIFYFLP